MTARPDGSVICDRCGQPITGVSGLTSAVTILAVGADGLSRTLHLGLADGCAAVTLLPAGLAARMAADPFDLYVPPPPQDNHPDTVSMSSSSVSTTEGNHP